MPILAVILAVMCIVKVRLWSDKKKENKRPIVFHRFMERQNEHLT